MSAWEIYMLTRLAALHEWLCPLGLVAGIVGSGCMCVNFMENAGRPDRGWNRLNKKILLLGACLFGLGILMPSQKDIGVMLALPYVSRLEGARELPDEALKAATKFLREYVEESHDK